MLWTSSRLCAEPACIDYGSYVNYSGGQIGPANRIVMDGDRCFSVNESHLFLHDVSDPDSPELLNFFGPPGSALAVAIDGNLAFLSDDSFHLMVLDYSDPEDPTLLATLVLAQDALALAVRDGYVFAALKTAGFAVVDVHDPENPEVVALLDTPGSATAIDLGPRLAFVAD